MTDAEEHAIGYQVLKRGHPVEASDGTRVGTLDKAIHHAREHMLDGIVVQTKDRRLFVDAPEVARITNLRILLTIDTQEFAASEPYKGVVSRMGAGAARRAKRRARRLRP